MAKKSPLDKIKDAAADAATTVVGTGQKMVDTAVGQAVAVAGAVSAKVPSRRRPKAPSAPARPVVKPEPQDASRKTQGDPLKPTKAPAKKAPAKKAPAKKAAAKKAPAKKTAKKAPVKKAPSAKEAVTAPAKAAAKKAPAKKAAAKQSATKAPPTTASEG